MLGVLAAGVFSLSALPPSINLPNAQGPVLVAADAGSEVAGTQGQPSDPPSLISCPVTSLITDQAPSKPPNCREDDLSDDNWLDRLYRDHFWWCIGVTFLLCLWLSIPDTDTEGYKA